MDQVSAAAATHLHPDALTLVVEGDAAVIRDDLMRQPWRLVTITTLAPPAPTPHPPTHRRPLTPLIKRFASTEARFLTQTS